jgi:hypothetical protein
MQHQNSLKAELQQILKLAHQAHFRLVASGST